MTKKMTAQEKQALMYDLDVLVDELNTSSDRAFGIVWPTYLEEQLANLLRGFLAATKITDGLFTSESQPLSTFSDKIKMCFALGLIYEFEYDDLELLRKIRNEFAHSLHGRSFADNDIKELCRRLIIPSRHKLPQGDPKTQFHIACASLSLRLSSRLVGVEHKKLRLKPWSDHELISETGDKAITYAIQLGVFEKRVLTTNGIDEGSEN